MKQTAASIVQCQLAEGLRLNVEKEMLKILYPLNWKAIYLSKQPIESLTKALIGILKR